jgi:hypothetical protein
MAFVAVPRAYAFDSEAVIQGARGRVCLEQILTPPKDTPLACWRVLARWTGLLRPRSVITVGDRRLVVLRVRPIDGRRTIAHILCRDAAAPPRSLLLPQTEGVTFLGTDAYNKEGNSTWA